MQFRVLEVEGSRIERLEVRWLDEAELERLAAEG
jgi:hypothetical protein